MTPEEKIATVRELVNSEEATTSLVSTLLKKAEYAIRSRMYPIRLPQNMEFSVPEQYEFLQCDLAARYFLRRGGEGETLHSENGIDRHYASVNDEDLLSEVIQVVV